ncbi:MAG: ABC transporter substrate-binding protein, partial [Oscillospiraceae bacterium]|nr:ABC transporter substrate-binding protein [Oscillospiraceae bacterium]
MKKILSLALALLMCLYLLGSCAPKSAEPSPPPETTAEQPSPPQTPPNTVAFTDSAGREVELPVPGQITKISPSGALSQMFLLAIAPDLLGTISSEYSVSAKKYVPEYVAELPVVGQFYGSGDLNFETIAALGMQLVIDVGEPKKTIVEDMDGITANLAIPAVHITATLDSTPEAFRTLGKILGREEKGEELAQYCERVLAQTNDALSAVGDDKPGILYLLGDAGTNVLAKTSFHAEVLDRVGNNLAVVSEPSGKGSGNETDLEQIAIWNPEVIIFGKNSVYAAAASDPVWSELDAIKNGRYIEVPVGPDNWMGMPPSINRYLGLLWLTKTLYPTAALYDLQAEVTEYYRLFYDYDLSAQDYAELTANAAFAPADT